jgi:hypothetical protein
MALFFSVQLLHSGKRNAAIPGVFHAFRPDNPSAAVTNRYSRTNFIGKCLFSPEWSDWTSRLIGT